MVNAPDKVSTQGFDRRQLGGWGLIAGDIALAAQGLAGRFLSDDPNDHAAGIDRIRTAILWFFGGAVLAKYGKQPVPAQMERLEEKLAAHLREHGVPLDAEVLAKADRQTQRGWFQKLEDFLYQYPTEVMNAWFGAASLLLIKAGYTDYQSGNKGGAMDIAAGISILAGGLFGILVKEKTKEQLIREGKDPENFWSKVQQRPLAGASGLYMANNGIGAYGTYKYISAFGATSKDDPKYKLSMAMAGISSLKVSSYVASNLLTGSGSKKAGGTAEERTSAQGEVVTMAAGIIRKLPEDAQASTASIMAQYLTHQHELRMSDQDAAELEGKILQAVQKGMSTASR